MTETKLVYILLAIFIIVVIIAIWASFPKGWFKEKFKSILNSTKIRKKGDKDERNKNEIKSGK